MPSNYKKVGTDLDDIFEPIGAETPIANTGYKVAGVDIAERYYPLSAGGTGPSVTGYKKAGADLNTLFAAIGTVVTIPNVTLPADFTVLDTDTVLSAGPTMTAEAGVEIRASGDIWQLRLSIGDQDHGSDWVDTKVGLDGNDFEVEATVVSGTLHTGTADAFLSLDVNRSWSVFRSSTASGTNQCVIDLEIRQKDNFVNKDTVRVTMNATTEILN